MVERVRRDGDTAGGSLVFTTSGSAYFGQQKGQHYGASKAGLIAMMRGIAVEHARHGIRANAVLPGWIESDMTAGALTGTASSSATCRGSRCAAGATAATSPASPCTSPAGASRYTTGDVITIDGGYHSF